MAHPGLLNPSEASSFISYLNSTLATWSPAPWDSWGTGPSATNRAPPPLLPGQVPNKTVAKADSPARRSNPFLLVAPWPRLCAPAPAPASGSAAPPHPVLRPDQRKCASRYQGPYVYG